MKIAVISITENGRRLSEKIAGGLAAHDCARYAFYKHTDDGARSFSDLKALVSVIFTEYDALVFVCACGIAVRAIAPRIAAKTTDPAVVVIDDCGRFAVSALSGHIGGANALAVKVAEITGARAVITTATDAGGLFSPDSFAKANNLHISDMAAAKAVAAAVIEGEKIGFISDYPVQNMPENYFAANARTGIYIGRADKQPFETTLRLIPKNICIGIGCKRNTEPERLAEFIATALRENSLPLYRVRCVSTIDLKGNERAVTEFCKSNKLPLRLYSAQDLMNVEGRFGRSEFVLKTTGADNVCERAAAACGGRLLVKKTTREGMTFAAAEEDIIIDFERDIL